VSELYLSVILSPQGYTRNGQQAACSPIQGSDLPAEPSVF